MSQHPRKSRFNNSYAGNSRFNPSRTGSPNNDNDNNSITRNRSTYVGNESCYNRSSSYRGTSNENRGGLRSSSYTPQRETHAYSRPPSYSSHTSSRYEQPEPRPRSRFSNSYIGQTSQTQQAPSLTHGRGLKRSRDSSSDVSADFGKDNNSNVIDNDNVRFLNKKLKVSRTKINIDLKNTEHNILAGNVYSKKKHQGLSQNKESKFDIINYPIKKGIEILKSSITSGKLQFHTKILKNSNIFIHIKDSLEFENIYKKYHADKLWISKNIPNCQVGFHKMNKTTYYIQLYLFDSIDLLLLIFYMFESRMNKDLRLNLAVHESTNLKSSCFLGFSKNIKITLVKQALNFSSYPGFEGYSFNINQPVRLLYTPKDFQSTSKLFSTSNLTFNGNINLVKDKFRKTITLKSFDFQSALLNQQMFYSKGDLLKPINQHKILDEFWGKLNRLNNKDIIQQIKTVENKSIKTEIKKPVTQDKNALKQAHGQTIQKTSFVTANTRVLTDRKVINASNNSAPSSHKKEPNQVTNANTSQQVVDLCLQIINVSLKKLDEINSKSTSPYTIVKSFVKIPRELYPNLPELTQFCKSISQLSTCNVIVLSYINIHQSVQWFKDLNLPWIDSLGETECKIINIGGVVSGCKSAINLIKKDIESRRVDR